MTPLPPNPLGRKVVAAASVGVFVDAIVIVLRLWSRKLRKRKLVLGDYLMIVAWALLLADLIRKGIAYKWGVGLHMEAILTTDPSHLRDAAKITFAQYFVWIACVTCIKLSVLLVYCELFWTLTWFIWCVRATMALVAMWSIAFTIATCLQCTPVAKIYWPLTPGHCGISLLNGFIVMGSINMLTDAIIVVLPIPVVLTLRIPIWKKIAVCAQFGLGTLILFVVGWRFKLIKEQNPNDYIHDGEKAGILIWLELYLGVISACAPFLTPPMAKLGTFVTDSTIYNRILSRNSQKSYDCNELERQSDSSKDKLPRLYESSQKSDEEATGRVEDSTYNAHIRATV